MYVSLQLSSPIWTHHAMIVTHRKPSRVIASNTVFFVAHAGKATARPDMPLPPLPTETRAGGGRMDMPLPPLPPSSSSSPPVPQRAQATAPSSSSSSQDGLSNSYPPLPPRNPRANGGASSPVPPQQQQQQQQVPQEPARGAPPSSASSAPRGQCREDSIMDLVTLGYSRSDVVRALSIARNDFNIAKGILMEFGGRV